MHDVEPFTYDLWICTVCGNLFTRNPQCEGCKTDPTMAYHGCEFDRAQIEGDCEPDPILTGGIN